jgi:hypothetical protein
MADIKITDNFGLNGDLQIRDNSPLAKAKLTQLVTTVKALFDDFNRPIDQADFSSVALGASAASPNLLDDNLPTTIGGGMNCTLSVTNAADKLLFKDGGFSPVIPIAPNQAWIGVELDVNLSADAKASADGVGVELAGAAKLTTATYSLISAPAGPLAAADAAPAGNPTGDKNFMKQRGRLANALGGIARNTDAAFVPGWGEAAMFALSGKRGQVSMDLQWDGDKLHFGIPVA